jgi:4-carboxymuconolactone decarboxylase
VLLVFGAPSQLLSLAGLEHGRTIPLAVRPIGLICRKPLLSIISWAEEVSVADSDLFQKGLKKRKQVLGEKYVDANLAGSDEFMMTFQRAVTELAWGYAWSRPGLDQKTRSLLTLGILGGLGRFQELGIYVNAALASGATVDEIKEALVQITVYCGTPAGRQAFLAAHDALKPSKE